MLKNHPILNVSAVTTGMVVTLPMFSGHSLYGTTGTQFEAQENV
jgi:hypothetical protein